jgi:8-oxo-dGTP diphosphatase
MATDTLATFPRPGLAVDLAILTVTDASTDPALRVLVQDRTDPVGYALPGRFMRERQTTTETARDVFVHKVGIQPGSEIRPRLLRLFDDPDRDERTWAISAAHWIPMREAALESVRGTLVPVSRDGRLDGIDRLLFDHDEIVAGAIQALRKRYDYRRSYDDHTPPDPDGFLAEPFTLHQLRRVHEAVLGERLHKDNFNRRMKQYEFVAPVLNDDESPALAENLRGRPAALYRRAGQAERRPE